MSFFLQRGLTLYKWSLMNKAYQRDQKDHTFDNNTKKKLFEYLEFCFVLFCFFTYFFKNNNISDI